MVSILMAVYNGEPYLEEQLQSLERQTMSEWRLLVRDDGSSDGTVKILQKLRDRVSQEVIILENRKEPHGAKYNFLALLEAASDSHIMFCEQDNIWKDDKVEKTLHKMQEAEKQYGKIPLLVHTDLEVVDDKGVTISKSFFDSSNLQKELTLHQLLIQNHVTGCTTMINGILSERIGQLSPACKEACIMHDYWIALYAQLFGQIVFLDEATIRYRQHGKNSVGAKNSKSAKYLFGRLQQGKRSYRENMKLSFKQIEAFVTCYKEQCQKLPEYELLQGYANLRNKNAWSRRQFYVKHKVWKQGSIRKIMQMIWG